MKRSAEFKTGRESLENDRISERPLTATTKENVTKIHQMLLRMIDHSPSYWWTISRKVRPLVANIMSICLETVWDYQGWLSLKAHWRCVVAMSTMPDCGFGLIGGIRQVWYRHISQSWRNSCLASIRQMIVTFCQLWRTVYSTRRKQSKPVRSRQGSINANICIIVNFISDMMSWCYPDCLSTRLYNKSILPVVSQRICQRRAFFPQEMNIYTPWFDSNIVQSIVKPNSLNHELFLQFRICCSQKGVSSILRRCHCHNKQCCDVTIS